MNWDIIGLIFLILVFVISTIIIDKLVDDNNSLLLHFWAILKSKIKHK